MELANDWLIALNITSSEFLKLWKVGIPVGVLLENFEPKEALYATPQCIYILSST